MKVCTCYSVANLAYNYHEGGTSNLVTDIHEVGPETFIYRGISTNEEHFHVPCHNVLAEDSET